MQLCRRDPPPADMASSLHLRHPRPRCIVENSTRTSPSASASFCSARRVGHWSRNASLGYDRRQHIIITALRRRIDFPGLPQHHCGANRSSSVAPPYKTNAIATIIVIENHGHSPQSKHLQNIAKTATGSYNHTNSLSNPRTSHTNSQRTPTSHILPSQ